MVVLASVTGQALQLLEAICLVHQHQVIGTTHILPHLLENKYGLFQKLVHILLHA
jgi:hypothetical protein